MAYLIKQKRRTCCTCGRQTSGITPGAYLRSAGYFRPFPTARMAADCTYGLLQPRVPEPFYDGPCGTEEEIPCCCQSNDFYPTYGYFTQFAPFSLEAGDPFPFNGDSNLSPTGVRMEDGAVILAQPGTYAVSYVINIPAGTAADTEFSFTVDGVEVPGMTVSAFQDTDGTGIQVFAQGIITTDRTTQLDIISSDAISFTGDAAIAALTLHRIA